MIQSTICIVMQYNQTGRMFDFTAITFHMQCLPSLQAASSPSSLLSSPSSSSSSTLFSSSSSLVSSGCWIQSVLRTNGLSSRIFTVQVVFPPEDSVCLFLFFGGLHLLLSVVSQGPEIFSSTTYPACCRNCLTLLTLFTLTLNSLCKSKQEKYCCQTNTCNHLKTVHYTAVRAISCWIAVS